MVTIYDKEGRIYNRGKTDSLVKCSGKTGELHVNK